MSSDPNTLLRHLNLLIKERFPLVGDREHDLTKSNFSMDMGVFLFPPSERKKEKGKKKRKRKREERAYVISFLPSETAKRRANLFSLIPSRFLQE